MLEFLRESVKNMQVGFVVKDLEQTMRGYYERFGIGQWHVYTYGPAVLKRMTRFGRACSYTMRLGLNTVCGTRRELIQQVEGDTVYREFIEGHGYGMHHLGVYVDDIDSAIAQAADAGFHVTMDGAGFGLDGDGYYAYLDTDPLLGTTYELIQRPLRRREPEAVFP
jgi:hypothetical protein